MDPLTEQLKGYLNALGCMNNDTDRSSDYFIEKLSSTHSIIDSLSGYYQSRAPQHPVEHWHPKLQATDFKNLLNEANRWFFEANAMDDLPDKIKNQIMSEFEDHIISMTIRPKFYELISSPPIWYGNLHTEFIIESECGIYLLHFSCHD